MKTIKRIHFPLELTYNSGLKVNEQFTYASGNFDEIHLIIRCLGGDVDRAIEFVDLIEESKSKVIAFADDKCHSAASIIFLSCHKRIITPETTMILHPQKISLTNEEYCKFLEWSKFFKSIRETCIEIYCKRTLLPKKRIKELCTCKEYCFNANEMMNFGMADIMIPPTFLNWEQSDCEQKENHYEDCFSGEN